MLVSKAEHSAGFDGSCATSLLSFQHYLGLMCDCNAIGEHCKVARKGESDEVEQEGS